MLIVPAATLAQDAETPGSKTEALQIGPRDGGVIAGEARRGVFLDEAPAPRARASLMQADGDQIGDRGAETAPQQLTSSGESARRMPQLSEAELEATLAQLTPVERSVLLQAIEGTDICDNPPAVAAVIALCRSRLETRSGEFAATPEVQLTSEERLLRGGVESNGLPTVEAVIARLSRVTLAASSDDFNNQAIASIALAPPPAAEKPAKEEDPAGLGLGSETEALINAIVQQLGGQGSGSP
ncbi:MAG: hypothetical protein ACK4GG_11520 [Sphingomonas sp.]